MLRRSLCRLAVDVARHRCRLVTTSAAVACSADPPPPPPLPGSVASRYRGLRDRPRIIHDIHEEQELARSGVAAEPDEPLWDPLDAWSTARGRTGVLDVEDVVAVLREDGMADVAVMRLPEQHTYVGHLVLATARSRQHMLTTAQFLRRLYKRRRSSADPVPRIEGKESHQWIAMDFVNVALHLFDVETRAQYDVDGLWAVGPRFDELSQPEEAAPLLTDIDPLADFEPWDAADGSGPPRKQGD